MSKVSLGRCLLDHHLKSRNMSQAEFARRLGIDKRRVSYYCHGERLMSPDIMYGASVLLDVPMESLYEFAFGDDQ
ncbi:helix-turn-helix transcriptional regulator [Paenibacillus campi]|uniref:helix-turn-helix transcriptional regulator n=1 Tax=Paenibacillus campi TaxID=3106031 RepID=UPI002AFE954F|nr:helix-turn-helix transcriptional regulator [Paenibacillus sp. SGZ-1014]